jgi:hypothetical protein
MSSVASAIKDFVKGMLAGIHTCMPGEIVSYDYTKQKATVKPLLKRSYVDGTTASYPVINDVPVVFPRSGGASLTFPVVVGDTVMLLFSERTMDLWLNKGTESISLVERQFSLNDAIAVPGLFPFTSASKASNNTDVELVFNSQKIVIKPNGDIEIGSSTLRALIDERIQAVFNGHGHEYVSPTGPLPTSVPISTGINPPPTLFAAQIILGTGLLETPVTTTKVKAQ